VLDFGFWSHDERSSLRSLAETTGASTEIVYLPVEREEQLRRIRERSIRLPQSSFAISAADLDRFRERFDEPDDSETRTTVPPPPDGWTSWADWARARWPSLAP
jgi:predicted kinase